MTYTTHFFLGANSGLGFQSLFDRFCAPEDHYDLVVLKGGSGCGKSTLMRRVGEAMEAAGETVEYLHCSGDPDSLDGIQIPRLRTAFVDGTAPHAAATKGHFYRTSCFERRNCSNFTFYRLSLRPDEACMECKKLLNFRSFCTSIIKT